MRTSFWVFTTVFLCALALPFIRRRFRLDSHKWEWTVFAVLLGAFGATGAVMMMSPERSVLWGLSAAVASLFPAIVYLRVIWRGRDETSA